MMPFTSKILKEVAEVLRDQASKLKPGGTIYAHPENIELIREQLAFNPVDEFNARYSGVLSDIGGSLRADLLGAFGIKFQASEYLPRFARRWVPPSGRFWEMEPSDEKWAAKLGYGRYEDDADSRIFYYVNPRLEAEARGLELANDLSADFSRRMRLYPLLWT